MVTYISGRQVTGTIQSAERKVDIPPRLAWVRPNNAPLVKLSSGRDMRPASQGVGLPTKKRVAINPEFKVLEKQPHGAWTAVNQTNVVTATTTITLDDVTFINVRDVLKEVAGGELWYVTAKSNGANTVTVTRAFGATAAGSVADNVPVYVVGNANEENAQLPNILMVQNRVRTNYTQIIRKVLGASRTLANSTLYQGKKSEELRKEAWLEWEKLCERAFLFSEPSEDLTGGPDGNPIRATGGAYYWISTGGGTVTTVTTTFTKSDWLTFVRNGFLYGSDTKAFLAAPLLVEMLDYWKDGKLEMRPNMEMFGIKVAGWETGQGTLYVVRDVELQNSPAGDGTGYGGTGFLLDAELLAYRYLTNSDVALLMNVVRNGQDGFTDEYLGEVGFYIEIPEAHAIVEDISTYS